MKTTTSEQPVAITPFRRRSNELSFQDFRTIARNQVRRDIAEFTPGEIPDVEELEPSPAFRGIKNGVIASLFIWAAIALVWWFRG